MNKAKVRKVLVGVTLVSLATGLTLTLTGCKSSCSSCSGKDKGTMSQQGSCAGGSCGPNKAKGSCT